MRNLGGHLIGSVKPRREIRGRGRLKIRFVVVLVAVVDIAALVGTGIAAQ
jgi:hypothetical protein